MKTIKKYLTKDTLEAADAELWDKKPEYNRERGYWEVPNNSEHGDLVTCDTLYDLVQPGQCIEIDITVGKIIYDYNTTPEGKLLNTIFNK